MSSDWDSLARKRRSRSVQLEKHSWNPEPDVGQRESADENPEPNVVPTFSGESVDKNPEPDVRSSLLKGTVDKNPEPDAGSSFLREAVAKSQHVSVSVVNNFTYEPFTMPGSEGDAYKAWKDWFQGLEHIMEASNIPEQKKFSTLLSYGGKELRTIYSAINNGTIPKVEQFGTAIFKLETYFKPKQHATYLRVKFWELSKEPNESIDEFVTRLHDKKRHCDFGSSKAQIEDFVMTDKFVTSMPQYIKQELMRDRKLTFQSAVRQAKEIESSRDQARELTTTSKEKPFFGAVNRIRSEGDRLMCFRCNSRNHKADSDRCPAREARCHSCKQKGHFAYSKYCTNSQGNSSGKREREYKRNDTQPRPKIDNEPRPKKRRGHVRNVKEEDEEELCNVNSGGVKVVCQIGDFFVKMLVDSGTNRNIIDDKTWQIMTARGFRPKIIEKGNGVKFFGYGGVKLKQVACFEAKIRARVNGEYHEEITTFFVIENGSQPLLSKGKESSRRNGRFACFIVCLMTFFLLYRYC